MVSSRRVEMWKTPERVSHIPHPPAGSLAIVPLPGQRQRPMPAAPGITRKGLATLGQTHAPSEALWVFSVPTEHSPLMVSLCFPPICGYKSLVFLNYFNLLNNIKFFHSFNKGRYFSTIGAAVG